MAVVERELYEVILAAKGIAEVKKLKEAVEAEERALGEMIVGTAKADQATAQFAARQKAAAETIIRLRSQLNQAQEGLNKVSGSSRNTGMAVLEMSRAFEDSQYGVAGVLNNIPGLIQMLGGGAGLAGAISVAAVAITILVKNWEEWFGILANDKTHKETERMKELEGATRRTAKEQAELNRLKAKEQAREEFDFARSKTVEDRRKAMQDVLEANNPDAIKAAWLKNAGADELDATEKEEAKKRAQAQVRIAQNLPAQAGVIPPNWTEMYNGIQAGMLKEKQQKAYSDLGNRFSEAAASNDPKKLEKLIKELEEIGGMPKKFIDGMKKSTDAARAKAAADEEAAKKQREANEVLNRQRGFMEKLTDAAKDVKDAAWKKAEEESEKKKKADKEAERKEKDRREKVTAGAQATIDRGIEMARERAPGIDEKIKQDYMLSRVQGKDNVEAEAALTTKVEALFKRLGLGAGEAAGAAADMVRNNAAKIEEDVAVDAMNPDKLQEKRSSQVISSSSLSNSIQQSVGKDYDKQQLDMLSQIKQELIEIKRKENLAVFA